MTLTNQEQTQKARRQYADYWGIAIGDVYYCDDCEQWTHNDEEDEIPSCRCY